MNDKTKHVIFLVFLTSVPVMLKIPRILHADTRKNISITNVLNNQAQDLLTKNICINRQESVVVGFILYYIYFLLIIVYI